MFNFRKLIMCTSVLFGEIMIQMNDFSDIHHFYFPNFCYCEIWQRSVILI